ncbi:MAG: hypothetical protein ACC661_08690, partial [Verrucomicrobiales bacterium]
MVPALVLLALVFTVAGYGTYRYRTAVVNGLLERFVSPYRVAIGEIGFPARGVVVIDGIEVGLVEGQEPILRVAELEVTYRREDRWQLAIE